MDMNTRPVTLSAYALDPRFHIGSQLSLSDEEWSVASKFIVDFAEREGHRRLDVLSDLAHYRAKTGPLFGDNLNWEAAKSSACNQNPRCWWSAFAAGSHLSKVARILLSMPATSAIIERCNKAYGMQKTKARNRLSSTRASKVAMVSYNLKVQDSIATPSRRCERRQLSILALSSRRTGEVVVNPATDSSERLPALPSLCPETPGGNASSTSAANIQSTTENSDDSGESDCEVDPNGNSTDDENVTSTVNTQIGTSGDFRTLAIRYHSGGATVYHRR